MNSLARHGRRRMDRDRQAEAEENLGVPWAGQTIRDTLVLIDASRTGAVVFLHPDRRIAGFVSDGDIRRALIRGAELSDPVSTAWTASPVTASSLSSINERHDLLNRTMLRQLIVVDPEGRFVELQMFEEVERLHAINPRRCPVLIMAGGLGQRLMPLTAETPKPMLRLGGEPLLERILKSLIAQGYQDFFVSVRYRKEQIIDYFGDGSRLGVSIRYLVEEAPRGTGGALRLLPPLEGRHLLVLNGDLVTDLDFRSLVTFHDSQGYAATMVVREATSQIDYGVVRVDGPKFVRLDEKPKQDYFINAGIYALGTSSLQRLPTTESFDMPDVFAKLVAEGSDCGVYEHRGQWLDIGTPEQFEAGSALAHTLPAQSP